MYNQAQIVSKGTIMFIKLTRIDGQDVWFNSQYVVTVEPRKGSGALVVPLGDGIDYEVRESPEMIVAMLGGDLVPDKTKRLPPATSVAAKPPSAAPADKVAKPSAVVSEAEPELPDFRINSSATPVPFELRNVPEAAEADVVTPPAKKTVRRKHTTAKTAADESPSAAKKKETSAEAPSEAPSEAAPKKKAVRKATTRKPKLPPMPLTDEQLVRLQKMAPGNAKRLANTLKAQFAVEEAEPVIAALQAHGVITINEQGRISWVWRTL